jgi:DNA-directed RNA polymerase subunit RPC12/RpoP
VVIAESSSSVADDDGWLSSGADQEEEEDMALCLMLLARGGRAGSSSSKLLVVAPDAADSTATAAKERKFRSRRPADGAGAEAGEFVYECKTCGRCFPSFQALGGHRTSHKKPRLLTPSPPPGEKLPTPPAHADEKKTTSSPSLASPAAQATADPTVLAIPATPPKQESAVATATGGSRQHQRQGRVHECSICGAEFASGQALGGHMRRHRPLVPASSSADTDLGVVAISGKENSILELDLNMPAPCEDAETASFALGGVKERSSSAAALLFPAPASALVDCHY